MEGFKRTSYIGTNQGVRACDTEEKDIKMEKALQHILSYPVLPVYYHDDPATCLAVAEACYKGGVRVFEFVHRGANAPANFQALLAHRQQHMPGLLLGIGTVKDALTAQRYIGLGADFIVSPVVKPEIAQETLANGILWVPGAMTPTEISLAEDLGAPLVKIFPGDTLGPGFVKAVKPLFPAMHFMPTGGVSAEASNIAQWFAAGVSAVGLGSKLFDRPEGAEGLGWLEERASAVMRWASESS